MELNEFFELCRINQIDWMCPIDANYTVIRPFDDCFLSKEVFCPKQSSFKVVQLVERASLFGG